MTLFPDLTPLPVPPDQPIQAIAEEFVTETAVRRLLVGPRPFDEPPALAASVDDFAGRADVGAPHPALGAPGPAEPPQFRRRPEPAAPRRLPARRWWFAGAAAVLLAGFGYLVLDRSADGATQRPLAPDLVRTEARR